MSMPAAKALVILLHGVGSSGSDLQPLATLLAKDLPGAIFVSPNAPDRSGFGAGYQWFSVAGVTTENRAGRIEQARPAFDATISAIVEQNGFSESLDKVVFVGFSQGTIMALDAVASGRWPVSAVVGFSGRLASPAPLASAIHSRILLVHGSADAVIPVAETEKAAEILHHLGAPVKTLIVPGLPHTISQEGAEHAGSFLKEIFPE